MKMESELRGLATSSKVQQHMMMMMKMIMMMLMMMMMMMVVVVVVVMTILLLLLLLLLEYFCVALFSGVPKLTALYNILQHFLSFTNIIHIIMTTNNV